MCVCVVCCVWVVYVIDISVYLYVHTLHLGLLILWRCMVRLRGMWVSVCVSVVHCDCATDACVYVEVNCTHVDI